MSLRATIVSTAATGACVLGAWSLGMPFTRAALLAPVLVLAVGAAIGLFVFWGRVGWASLRTSRNPRLLVAATVAFVAIFVVLAVLGVNLPRE